MPYQSKTYSLSDEVVAAIEAAREQGETPNQFLRRLLKLPKRVLHIRLNLKPGEKLPISIVRNKAYHCDGCDKDIPASSPHLCPGKGVIRPKAATRPKGDKTR